MDSFISSVFAFLPSISCSHPGDTLAPDANIFVKSLRVKSTYIRTKNFSIGYFLFFSEGEIRLSLFIHI